MGLPRGHSFTSSFMGGRIGLPWGRLSHLPLLYQRWTPVVSTDLDAVMIGGSVYMGVAEVDEASALGIRGGEGSLYQEQCQP